jgi:RNA polymerase sigma factor (TIGR02999 family)
MENVTTILEAIERGEPNAADRLIPLVYEELRRVAACKLAQEKPGQTLSPTALVHEAYLRMFGSAEAGHWRSRGQFFAAAAESMRRILVDNAWRSASNGCRTLCESIPGPISLIATFRRTGSCCSAIQTWPITPSPDFSIKQ